MEDAMPPRKQNRPALNNPQPYAPTASRAHVPLVPDAATPPTPFPALPLDTPVFMPETLEDAQGGQYPNQQLSVQYLDEQQLGAPQTWIEDPNIRLANLETNWKIVFIPDNYNILLDSRVYQYRGISASELTYQMLTPAPWLPIFDHNTIVSGPLRADFDQAFDVQLGALSLIMLQRRSRIHPYDDTTAFTSEQLVFEKFREFIYGEGWVHRTLEAASEGLLTERRPADLVAQAIDFPTIRDTLHDICYNTLLHRYRDEAHAVLEADFRVSCDIEAFNWCYRILQQWTVEEE